VSDFELWEGRVPCATCGLPIDPPKRDLDGDLIQEGEPIMEDGNPPEWFHMRCWNVREKARQQPVSGN
jgi:hypothetical protein